MEEWDYYIIMQMNIEENAINMLKKNTIRRKEIGTSDKKAV